MHVIMKKISSGADYQGEEEFMGTLQELQRREAKLAQELRRQEQFEQQHMQSVKKQLQMMQKGGVEKPKMVQKVAPGLQK